MAARAALALVALAILRTSAQPTSTYVYVRDDDPTLNDVNDVDDLDEVEKRYTPELVVELESAKEDALLLYTEYTARSGAELKGFIAEVRGIMDEFKKTVEDELDHSPSDCRTKFEEQLLRATRTADRAATFSAGNHHKFYLGHMIVFRMHLNKSEDYIRKCDKVYKDCGIACETTPRVLRWRRFAAQEINRVRDDIQHSRRSYHDLLSHSHRKLNHLRKRARDKAAEAVEELKTCARG